MLGVKGKKDLGKEELYRVIEELKEENKKLKGRKKYGLVWEEHEEDLDKKDVIPLLKYREDLSIVGDKGKPQNYLIEGDNYHALKVLQHTHQGKIDVIYIDPPYNTGNKDFVYNDSFVDKDDGFRHSKWLSFMSKRLELARELLSDDGVIFVSIDDNEQAQLKLLMDSIFGEQNFITSLPRVTTVHRSGQNKYMNIAHDYVLIYGILTEFKNVIEREYNISKVKQDTIGRYIEGDTATILASISQGYSAGGDYDFEYEGKVYKPITSKGVRHRWLWGQERMEKAIELGILVPTCSGGIRVQLYLDKKFDVKTNRMVPKEELLQLHSQDMYDKRYTNNNGSREIGELGLGTAFSYPKPVELIKLLIKLQSKKDVTVLDFFAGSGTTGHAVMELNKDDGGNRSFILCTNNEVSEENERKYLYEQGLINKNNKFTFNKYKRENEEVYKKFLQSKEYENLGIARAVTRERIKRVIEGYTTPRGKEIEGLGGNLTYLQTEEFEKGSTEGMGRRKLVKKALNSHYLKYPKEKYETVVVDLELDVDSYMKKYKEKDLVFFIDVRDVGTLNEYVKKLFDRFGKEIYIEVPENYYSH